MTTINPYIPVAATVTSVVSETPDVLTITISANGSDRPHGVVFNPGQFAMLSVLGVGECPISIASSASDPHALEFSIKCMGKTTQILTGLEAGDKVGLRGPFGNGFDMPSHRGEDLLFVAGGIGLAAVRSALLYVIEHRESFGDIALLYGARSPEDVVYKEELAKWTEAINVHVTVDAAGPEWDGNVGLITTLFDKVSADYSRYLALMCGPSIMIHFVTQELEARGIPPERILVSLERYMNCGVGMCGHCYTGEKLVCREGPVFSVAQMDSLVGH